MGEIIYAIIILYSICNWKNKGSSTIYDAERFKYVYGLIEDE